MCHGQEAQEPDQSPVRHGAGSGRAGHAVCAGPLSAGGFPRPCAAEPGQRELHCLRTERGGCHCGRRSKQQVCFRHRGVLSATVAAHGYSADGSQRAGACGRALCRVRAVQCVLQERLHACLEQGNPDRSRVGRFGQHDCRQGAGDTRRDPAMQHHGRGWCDEQCVRNGPVAEQDRASVCAGGGGCV